MQKRLIAYLIAVARISLDLAQMSYEGHFARHKQHCCQWLHCRERVTVVARRGHLFPARLGGLAFMREAITLDRRQEVANAVRLVSLSAAHQRLDIVPGQPPPVGG
jgi:hypothetical protein